jgi:hypothetical protein
MQKSTKNLFVFLAVRQSKKGQNSWVLTDPQDPLNKKIVFPSKKLCIFQLF